MGRSGIDRPKEAEAAPPEPRVAAAFRAWLVALATDADAATAAAMAYEALEPSGRDAWLDALEAEAPSLGVPLLAVYAPLLGVETDTLRSGRIEAALAKAPPAAPPAAIRALRGVQPSGDVVAALVIPLYLDFVELLICRYQTETGVISVRRGPLVRTHEVLGESPEPREIEGARVREVPMGVVVEELAHAVVADRRHGRTPPESLASYGFLFTPDLADVVRSTS